MTREEHIEAAESLLAVSPATACACGRCHSKPTLPSPESVARAQVHAMLALAMSPAVAR